MKKLIYIIKSINKNKQKNRSDLNNYKVIVLSSILLKLLEYIITDKLGDKLISSEYQFPYKKNPSTLMGYFLLDQTIDYFPSENSNVYCILLTS